MTGATLEPVELRIQTFTDAASHRVACEAVSLPRVAVERLLAKRCRSRPLDRLRLRLGKTGRRGSPGYCLVCGKPVVFGGPAGAGDAPNFREGLQCPRCGLNNRQRFMAAYALGQLESRGAASRMYCYEQVTPFFSVMRDRLGERALGSEYLGAERTGGELVGATRHEDASALSFPDASFDVLVSNDVFEHVFDVDAALAEACRVLRPGGVLLFSVPFHGTARSERCTELRDGMLMHICDPEYHGDPVRSSGSLVHHRFGWDLLEFCRRAGFEEGMMICYYSLLFGHVGGAMQSVFRADKAL